MDDLRKRSFFHRNSLSIVFLALFAASLAGQAVTGCAEYNDFLREHGSGPVTLGNYFASGHFLQATFENWESEFLQMALFVVFTVFLRQRGSSESKKPGDETIDRSSLEPIPGSPWPVRKGGIFLAVYRNSLSIALALLFALSFALHWYGSWIDHLQREALSGGQPLTFGGFACSGKLWFESFQNWQSEFLSVFAIVFLSIYLRQAGSPQSKKVNAPHADTGV